MSGSINPTLLLEVAKLNGIEDDLLNDFIDFVKSMEDAQQQKRNDAKK